MLDRLLTCQHSKSFNLLAAVTPSPSGTCRILSIVPVQDVGAKSEANKSGSATGGYIALHDGNVEHPIFIPEEGAQIKNA